MKNKTTYTMYLDDVKDLALKDIEIIQLEQNINKMLVNNSDDLYDDILSDLGEAYFKLETLKNERDILRNNFLQSRKEYGL